MDANFRHVAALRKAQNLISSNKKINVVDLLESIAKLSQKVLLLTKKNKMLKHLVKARTSERNSVKKAHKTRLAEAKKASSELAEMTRKRDTRREQAQKRRSAAQSTS